MLAASLGYRRDEEEKLKKLNELDFGVRIDQAGVLLRDYHIAQKLKANGTLDRNYVTNRYYLSDAIFLVALSHNDDDFINEIYESLKKPYFQIFLGKRSCPVTYDFIMGIYEEEAIELLKKTDWQASKFNRLTKGNRLKICGDSKIINNSREKLRKDKAISFSQKERKFDYRGESFLYIEVDRNVGETEHDAFGAIGG